MEVFAALDLPAANATAQWPFEQFRRALDSDNEEGRWQNLKASLNAVSNGRLKPAATGPKKTNYDVQTAGAAKQDPILLHEAESWLPMLVFLMVTQKTNTTKSTIKAYSTSPWPSSSTMSFFKSCIYSPPLLWGGNAREVPGKRGTLLFRLLTRKHQNNFAVAGKNTLIIWRQIQKGIVGPIGLCSWATIYNWERNATRPSNRYTICYYAVLEL